MRVCVTDCVVPREPVLSFSRSIPGCETFCPAFETLSHESRWRCRADSASRLGGARGGEGVASHQRVFRLPSSLSAGTRLHIRQGLLRRRTTFLCPPHSADCTPMKWRKSIKTLSFRRGGDQSLSGGLPKARTIEKSASRSRVFISVSYPGAPALTACRTARPRSPFHFPFAELN